MEQVKSPAKNGPTAVFCYNDEMALLLLDACRENGLSVPRDVSLVGFDNNILAHAARPRLTTVNSPVYGIAQTAVELVLTQLNEPDTPPPDAPLTVAPTLVVGESSGRRRFPVFDSNVDSEEGN